MWFLLVINNFWYIEFFTNAKERLMNEDWGIFAIENTSVDMLCYIWYAIYICRYALMCFVLHLFSMQSTVEGKHLYILQSNHGNNMENFFINSFDIVMSCIQVYT